MNDFDTAIHEAGHALVAMALAVPVKAISVRNGDGWCDAPLPGGVPLAAKAVIVAGGFHAERRAGTPSRIAIRGAEHDLNTLDRIEKYLLPDFSPHNVAARIVEAHFVEVMRLAKALQIAGALTGEEAARHCPQAIDAGNRRAFIPLVEGFDL